MIRLESISARKGRFTLDDVTFALDRGSFGVVIGPAGSGKTTLLEVVAGLLQPTGGRLTLGTELNKLYHTLNTGEAIPVSVSHGDFTPWNMYCDENRLYVYDWELSENGIPMLFDLYHFIFQSQVMVQHQNYTNIRQSIKDTVKKHNVQRLVNKYRIDTGLHYQLYLMFNISYYMRLFIEEKELLTQSHWMVDAWMDALEDVNKVK